VAERSFGLSLEEAARLHGHLGPWLVVGYRAGARAREILKPATEHDLFCTVRVPMRRPYTCTIDGVQASSGCTMGKLNIVAEDSDDIVFEFVDRRSGRRIVLKLHRDAWRSIEEALGSRPMEEVAEWVRRLELEKLFEEIVE